MKVTGFFGKARQSILTLLFSSPDQIFYTREIANRTENLPSAVHKELRFLTKKGILCREKRGNKVYYKTNKNNLIFSELKQIIFKTTGIGGMIRNELVKLKTEIEIAFIYGSFATGDEQHDSDVDIMIIGNVTLEKIVSSIIKIQIYFNREINPIVYTASKFTRKIKRNDPFVKNVLAGTKFFLVGGENELRKLDKTQEYYTSSEGYRRNKEVFKTSGKLLFRFPTAWSEG